MKVVFVCTGNTCRSPMAEYLFRHMLENETMADWTVASAGVAASPGRPPSLKTVKVLEEEGVSGIRLHQATPVEDLEVNPGDLVLSMTRSHHLRVRDTIPDEGVKTAVLKDYVGQSGSFPDPYGESVQRYRDLREEMKDVLGRLIDRLRDESEAS